MSFRKRGYVTIDELKKLTRLPPLERIKRGPVAVAECVENIPCNVCMTACPTHAISVEGLMGEPRIDWDKCIGCGICVGTCPGQALFLVHLKGTKGEVTLPYEFLPRAEKGAEAVLLNRRGEEVGTGRIVKVFEINKTQVVTVEVPSDLVWEVRAIWVRRKN